MPIPVTKYVKINSGVAGSSAVSARNLVERLFTSNPLLPPINPLSTDTQYGILQFSSALDVGNYFGTTSEEYFRAVGYFLYKGKAPFFGRPPFIQYSRWVSVATAPMIFPIKNNGSVLANWTSISAGAFTLMMGGFTGHITGMDFTEAANLAAVATIIQSAVQAETGGGAIWTAATVTYSATYGGFLLDGGAVDVVTNPITVSASTTGTDITGLGLLGWLPREQVVANIYISGSIWATGAAVETLTETLTYSSNISNNFASICFMNNLNLTTNQKEEIAAFVVEENAKYIYLTGINAANAVTLQQALADYGYTGITISGLTNVMVGTLTSSSPVITGITSTDALQAGQPISATNVPSGARILTVNDEHSVTMTVSATGSAVEPINFFLLEYPDQLPASIAAATNYNSDDAVQNFMYQFTAGLTPSVSDLATATAFDAINVNYYGVTQQAGNQLAFYQNGFLQGLVTDPLDMGVAYNEIWLKDQFTTQFLGLLYNTGRVPTGTIGNTMLTSVAQSVIVKAVDNGVIDVGKNLTDIQKSDIGVFTDDPNAWQQVVAIGYWFSLVIEPNDDATVYTAYYRFVYSKGDSVRFVDGEDVLI